MEAVQSKPDVLGGTPCFAGTRVPVVALVDHLRLGYTVDYFLSQFPTVGRAQVESVLDSIKAGLSTIPPARRAAG